MDVSKLNAEELDKVLRSVKLVCETNPMAVDYGRLAEIAAELARRGQPLADFKIRQEPMSENGLLFQKRYREERLRYPALPEMITWESPWKSPFKLHGKESGQSLWASK